ncbi:hypothetical protein [Lentzea sp. NEAU-D7]|uniref:hypothetical protein n=1 Tax=Lentzea sp. NEAU-D7 TaxID=2994667 RepID=UPI00224B8352|nr:hypothetical protein [Lentzea sp. NEAU-D7]MCX2952956.1 hypothetical protein [Lentzea sp. NEAU-D7]
MTRLTPLTASEAMVPHRNGRPISLSTGEINAGPSVINAPNASAPLTVVHSSRSSSVQTKLDARNRVEIAAWARESRLVGQIVGPTTGLLANALGRITLMVKPQTGQATCRLRVEITESTDN